MQMDQGIVQWLTFGQDNEPSGSVMDGEFR